MDYVMSTREKNGGCFLLNEIEMYLIKLKTTIWEYPISKLERHKDCQSPTILYN